MHLLVCLTNKSKTNIYHVPPFPNLARLLLGLGSKNGPRQEHRIFVVPERQLDTFNSEALAERVPLPCNNWDGTLVV